MFILVEDSPTGNHVLGVYHDRERAEKDALMFVGDDTMVYITQVVGRV